MSTIQIVFNTSKKAAKVLNKAFYEICAMLNNFADMSVYTEFYVH